MVKSPTQRMLDRRKHYRMIICGQGIQRNRRTEQLSPGNALRYMKQDGALKELNEFKSASKFESK